MQVSSVNPHDGVFNFSYSANEGPNGAKQWHDAWENLHAAYTEAMLKAGTLVSQEIREINQSEIIRVITASDKALDSSVTRFLSLARMITNAANKTFKAMSLVFGSVAIINTLISPINLPYAALSGCISFTFFLTGSISRLATTRIDEAKDKWINSYFKPEQIEEIKNLRKLKQIKNLDEIYQALQAVDTAYNQILVTYGPEIYRFRSEWNETTMASHQACLKIVTDYKNISESNLLERLAIKI